MTNVNVDKNSADATTLVAAPAASGYGAGRSVRVHGLSLHVKGANKITLEDTDGTVLATFDCAAETHLPWPLCTMTPYLATKAGKGLVLRATTTAVVSGVVHCAVA